MNVRDDAALIRQLKKHRVPHVVIGGWAVIAHGYVRATRDIDVLVPDTPEVRGNLGIALAEIALEADLGLASFKHRAHRFRGSSR